MAFKQQNENVEKIVSRTVHEILEQIQHVDLNRPVGSLLIEHSLHKSPSDGFVCIQHDGGVYNVPLQVVVALQGGAHSTPPHVWFDQGPPAFDPTGKSVPHPESDLTETEEASLDEFMQQVGREIDETRKTLAEGLASRAARRAARAAARSEWKN